MSVNLNGRVTRAERKAESIVGDELRQACAAAHYDLLLAVRQKLSFMAKGKEASGAVRELGRESRADLAKWLRDMDTQYRGASNFRAGGHD